MNVVTGTLAETLTVDERSGTLTSTVIVWQVAPAETVRVLMPLMVAQAASLEATWTSVRLSLEKSRCVLSS